jgi:hypothetical protein
MLVEASENRERGLRLHGEDLHASRIVVDVVAADQLGQAVEQFRRLARRLSRCAAGSLLRIDGALRWLTAAAPGLILNLRVGVQVRPGVDDFDVGKARLDESLSVLLNRNRPGDATDVGPELETLSPSAIWPPLSETFPKKVPGDPRQAGRSP